MEVPGNNKFYLLILPIVNHESCRQKLTEGDRNSCNVYGIDAIAASTAQDWFLSLKSKFKNCNFNLDDAPRWPTFRLRQKQYGFEGRLSSNDMRFR